MNKLIVATGFIFLIASKGLLAQCTGVQSVTVTPTPNGTCIPGTVYTVCYTMDGFNDLGANWIDGFEVSLSGPWVPGSLTGTTAPANCDGGIGNWLWVNSVTGASSGVTHGAGYYFDNTVDGDPGNDFGDYDANDGCAWTMCFEVTVGNTPGANLSVGVTALSDGEVGSWGSTACSGTSFSAFSCIIDEPCGTLDVVVDQHETCAGDLDGQATATMTGGAAPITFSWNSVPVQNTATATGLAAGNYTVTATDDNGCVLAEPVTINAGGTSDATIININANNELCENDAAVQVTTVEAGGTFTGSGISASGLFDPATANIGINTITYTIGGVCPSIEDMDITVIANDDASIIDINTGNIICLSSGTVQLTTVQTGGTWTGAGVNATGIFDPAISGLGPHTITYSFGGLCGDIQTIDITVTNLDYTIATTSSFCTADNGTATVAPTTGTAPYTYLWPDGQATQTAIDLPGGNYAVHVTDASGCTLTQAAVVVLDQGDLTANITTFTNASCNGGCDGTASATGVDGTPPYLYVWDDPTNQTTAQATGLCAGTYNVGIADANGCLTTAQIIITEPIILSVTAVMDIESNCNLPDGEATATTLGGMVAVDYQYSWNSTPVQTTATATGLVPNTYTVTVTDDNNCTASVDVDITASAGFTADIINSTDALCFLACDGTAEVQANPGFVGALSYSWDTAPAQNTAIAINVCAGTYQATITDAVGCIATADVIISEPVKVTATVATSASPICIGESADLSSTIAGGTPPYAGFNWSAAPADISLIATQQNPTVSPIITTEYTFVGNDNNGCDTDPAVVTIIVYDQLSLDVTRPLFSPDTSICPYDSATINLQGIGGDGNYSYFLEPDLVNPITVPMYVQPTATTGYAFMVTDGCTTPPAFATSNITVHVLPEVNFVADELTGCDPHTINLTDLTNPTPASWSWNFDDPNSSENTSPLQNPSHAFSEPGLYTVSLSVISPEGCVQDSVRQDYIDVYPLPYANFAMDPEVTNVLTGTVNFTDQSVGQLTSWEWSFGTGDVSLEQNPVYNYTDTGTFLVWMQVTTDMGCQDQTTREVTIEPDFMFYVPNSFTPNGDGKNDFFRGYGEGVKWDTYEMYVFNRWGEEVFYTNNVDNSWDGTIEGKEAPLEVYVWKIHLFDQTGEPRTYRGRVTLFR
jgi:gliding motility-associated-like protein